MNENQNPVIRREWKEVGRGEDESMYTVLNIVSSVSIPKFKYNSTT
jgi:hypothetical protein